MRWRSRQKSRHVEDRRGKGTKVAAGGGLGFLGVALVVYLAGGDPSYFLQEGIQRSLNQAPTQKTVIPTEKQNELVDFVSVVLAETETMWTQKFQEKGLVYKKPILVFFSGATASGCGHAQSAMGPFYCPLDQKVYIDLDFFYDLSKRHGAPGDFAQAYVVAHEVGHHVQNLLGILDKTHEMKKRTSKTNANKISVHVELMADCFAGIWAKTIEQRGLLEAGDIKEALKATTQIGDDRLQQQAQGYVVPDSFTHGSGDQRYHAFRNGYRSGSIDACLASRG